MGACRSWRWCESVKEEYDDAEEEQNNSSSRSEALFQSSTFPFPFPPARRHQQILSSSSSFVCIGVGGCGPV